MSYVLANFVRVYLEGDVAAGASSIDVQKADGPWGDPPAPGSETGVLVLCDSLANPNDLEVITYTGRTDNGDYWTLTGVTKGVEGTSDQDWKRGDVGILPATAAMLNQRAAKDRDETVSGNWTFDTGAEEPPFTLGAQNQDQTIVGFRADLLDGYHAGHASGEIPVSDATVNTDLNADLVDGYHAGHASGEIPVSDGALNTDLNADRLDGYEAADLATRSEDESITGQWAFEPDSEQAPFTLGNNAQGQLVTGLNAEQLDGFDQTDFLHASGDALEGNLDAASTYTLKNLPDAEDGGDPVNKSQLDAAQMGADAWEAVEAQQNDPPASPSDGDAYLVGPSPSGDWAGHANERAIWDAGAGAWDYWAIPNKQTFVGIKGTDIDGNSGRVRVWNGSSWVYFGSIMDHGVLQGTGDDDHLQYVHKSIARSITAQHTFAPGSVQAPFVLGANAQGQLVSGLNAEQVGGDTLQEIRAHARKMGAAL